MLGADAARVYCVLGRCVASTAGLIPKPFGGRWQWRTQIWQSLQEGAEKRCSESGQFSVAYGKGRWVFSVCNFSMTPDRSQAMRVKVMCQRQHVTGGVSCVWRWSVNSPFVRLCYTLCCLVLCPCSNIYSLIKSEGRKIARVLNAIQLCCLCVEISALYLVVYIKHSIHFTIKHQQFHNTLS